MDRFSSQQSPGFVKSFIKYYLAIFLIFIAFGGGLFLGNSNLLQNDKNQCLPNSSASADDFKSGEVKNKNVKPDFLSKDVDFKLFWETWDTIEKNYLRQPVSETEMLYGALAGSVASLGDAHSVFFDPKTTQDFTNELSGKFDGIGAEIAIKNDHLTVVAALPETPAEKAGLKSGDKILAIDGQDTSGMSLDFAVNQIRGQKGTQVALSITRNGLDTIEELKITRDTIKIQSVKWTMLPNNIAHLELRYFNEDTSDAFNQAILEITAQNPKGIIFDMRNNPGGFLDTAIGIASEWVATGPVVYERARNGKLTEHKAEGQARLKDFKTIVLINGGSASGSEIVAGALKDLGLAKLVGETTFGKGSVQTLFPLEDGSSVKLTIAEWLTPNQNMIDGVGIEPDVKVELTDEDFNADKDPQLDKAVEMMNQ